MIQRRVLGLIILSFIVSACSTSERFTSSKMPAHKMTPTNEQNIKLRLGMSLKISGLDKTESQALADTIREQITVFSPCMSQTGKTEVVRLKSEFGISSRGLAQNIKIIQVLPASRPFESCFTKHIEQLDMGRNMQKAKVFMDLGTYYGSPDGWDAATQPFK